MKFEIPAWENCNTLKHYPKRPDIVEANNKLRKQLARRGWEFRESVNIVETGYTLCFTKDVTAKGKGIFPRLSLKIYWDNCGGPDFWRGDMYGMFNYRPNYRYLAPLGVFEVRDILARDLKNLRGYEERLNAALASQTVV